MDDLRRALIDNMTHTEWWMKSGMQTNCTQQSVAHSGQKQNLLDDINLFPSKEEGRIPGGRRVASERKIKKPRPVSACVCIQREVICAIHVTSEKENVLFEHKLCLEKAAFIQITQSKS